MLYAFFCPHLVKHARVFHQVYLVIRYEGLILSVGGNGRSYVIILEAGPLADLTQNKKYFARINTKAGFCRVRNLPLEFSIKSQLIFPLEFTYEICISLSMSRNVC